MTTAREIFTIAMAMIDGLDGRTGAAESADTRDYQFRAPPLLTQITAELSVYSDALGGEPVASLDREFGDDYMARAVIPCALASRLTADENPSVSSHFERRYYDALSRYSGSKPQSFGSVADVYGGLSSPGSGGAF
ncbi:MAG: hypothetical protein LBS90_00990 [Oscillospiraceae bacterium]|jgi:hypothetical protein|nr:hypothetical protein [Oscillospiraceae bacterium]